MSLLRILLIPLIILLLCSTKRYLVFLSLILFVVAGITDGLDGYMARKMHMKSTFGLYLDPLADKLLVSLVLITMTYLKLVPLWITILIIGREFVITSVRAFYAFERFQLVPSSYGKLKTVFQILGISLIVFYLSGVWKSKVFYSLGTSSLYIALFFSLFSAYRYLCPLFKVSTKSTS